MFRLLVLVLLGFAVPVQGFAAVSAAQCMAFGHHGDSEHHAHGDGEDHAHDGPDRADAGAELPHCGPCVACCASVSIAGKAELPLLASRSEARYFFAQFPPLGIQPEGLDRPPLAL